MDESTSSASLCTSRWQDEAIIVVTDALHEIAEHVEHPVHHDHNDRIVRQAREHHGLFEGQHPGGRLVIDVVGDADGHLLVVAAFVVITPADKPNAAMLTESAGRESEPKAKRAAEMRRVVEAVAKCDLRYRAVRFGRVCKIGSRPLLAALVKT